MSSKGEQAGVAPITQMVTFDALDQIRHWLGELELHESINMLHELERTIRREWAWQAK